MNKRYLYFLTLSLSLVGYVWLSWNLFEQSEMRDTPTLCLVKHITGIPCPSCGTTTAMIELVHGNFFSSLIINPFGLMMMAVLIIFPGWIIADLLRKRESFFRFYRWFETILQQRRWVSVPAVLVVVINWIWNISKGL
ncbi:MAG: DUF2752 domain-containing protein [Bacteroidota bacterium]|nr:DUF2752 domain-containing protein [Bacteroidota bacterium]